jgi:hypothetical protein
MMGKGVRKGYREEWFFKCGLMILSTLLCKFLSLAAEYFSNLIKNNKIEIFTELKEVF